MLLYYAIACGWAWLGWSPIVLGTSGLKVLPIAVSIPVFICIGTLGPLFGCFVAHRVKTGNWDAVRLLPDERKRWLWIVVGPLLVLTCLFLIFPTLISEGGPRQWHWRPAAIVGLWIPMFNYNLFGGPLFEEFGWRGFLQTQLQSIMPPWAAAICVGVMWAAWHAPLFVSGFGSSSPATYLLILVGLSILMAYAFNSAGGAVVVAILMHSAFNSSSRFLDPFLNGTHTYDTPSAEMFIAFSFLSLAILIALLTRGRLGISGESNEFLLRRSASSQKV